MKILYLGFICVLIVFFVPKKSSEPLIIQEVQKVQEKNIFATTTLFFVGDVMLGRHVESIISRQGVEYPFVFVKEFITLPDITIGNFEGIVSDPHIHTPDMSFTFSVKADYLTYLQSIGFDILSLANNHSFDFGNDSLENTRFLCKTVGLVCGGSPQTIDETSTYIQLHNNKQIGFLFAHVTWNTVNDEDIMEQMSILASQSDYQVVYIHWGNEYELTHSERQLKLAEKLIDAGADVIIGHHPHVVQDIALYKNKPIFFSLGNFIFDQYFEEAVQTELGIQVSITADGIHYQLVPFSSVKSHSQPKVMEPSERQVLFNRIFSNVTENQNIDKELGTIFVQQ